MATYHYDLQQPLIIPDYVAANALTTTNVSLRGYHEYLTYIKNEPLLIQADLMDMNREAGDDPVELLVLDADGVLVANQLLEDDGVIEASNQGSAMRSVALVKNDLTEGVYKVILKADRDIFFRRLTTRQRYMTLLARSILAMKSVTKTIRRRSNFGLMASGCRFTLIMPTPPSASLLARVRWLCRSPSAV